MASWQEHNVLSLEDESLQGKAEILEATFAIAKSMALNTAIVLGIPDAISKRSPDAFLTLEEIAADISAQNIDFLFRLMRFLVYHNIFAAKHEDMEIKYGLTRASKWLIHKSSASTSLSPLCKMLLGDVIVTPWLHIYKCILDGSKDVFAKAHNKTLWEFTASNTSFDDIFNSAMVSASNMTVPVVLQHYDGFKGIKTLVDVGGGLGSTLFEIVRIYPHIRGINFDVDHVIQKAPSIPGVEHIAGDMFKEIPKADAVLMQWIMHDWEDEKCTTVLKNCFTMLPNGGLIIIIDAILDEESLFTSSRMAMDMLMMSNTVTGKERTKAEWMQLLTNVGFQSVKFQNLPDLKCVIEATKM